MGLLVAAMGCKSSSVEPRTEVLFQIEAEPRVKLAADHLVVEIASGPKNASALTAGDPEDFDLRADGFAWPASLALVAKAGHEDHVFEVVINIEANGKRLARSRVKSSFLKHQTLLLKTLLYGECLNRAECSGDETCVAPEGKPRCDSADVDPSNLPAYTADRAAGQPAVDAGVEPAAGSGGSDPRPAAGSGGAAPTGGAGAGGAAADGGMPSCEKKGAEQCDNGVDDDCNGKVDCADPACSAIMQCVPNGNVVGVLVPESSPCPAGFDKGEQLLYRGLNDPGCGGCSCEPVPTICKPQIWFYTAVAPCTTDVAPFSGGQMITTPIPKKPDCTASPVGSAIGMDTPVAWRTSVAKGVDACSPIGTATRLPPTWNNTAKLCVTTAKRNGCDAGSACVPKVSTGKVCTQREVAGCPSSTNAQTWQRDYADERTCSACGCAAQGGSCSDVTVNLGHDWSCNTVDSSLHDGEKACMLSTYSPPAFWSGTPTDPTCSAGAQVTGTLKPTSPLELCCAN
jgi:hypothetical protein